MGTRCDECPRAAVRWEWRCPCKALGCRLKKVLIQGDFGKMNEDEHFQGLVGSSSEQGERWKAWEMGEQ